MTTVSVIIPVLDRPERVRPLVDSIMAAATVTSCLAVFVASPDDVAEIQAVKAARSTDDLRVRLLVMPEPSGPGDYAKKINTGVDLTDSPFMLFGADDLVFRPGWMEYAIARHLETGACVVATNDLGNDKVMRGDHATHPFVCRSYVECGTIDEPDSGKLLHEGYGHQHVDNEFTETAQARGTFAFAPDSVVEHLHPFWGKGKQDATYRKGQSSAEQDRRLFQQRRKLWA